jgi:hypothetical protein
MRPLAQQRQEPPAKEAPLILLSFASRPSDNYHQIIAEMLRLVKFFILTLRIFLE